MAEHTIERFVLSTGQITGLTTLGGNSNKLFNSHIRFFARSQRDCWSWLETLLEQVYSKWWSEIRGYFFLVTYS